jgi:hypothetical protein
VIIIHWSLTFHFHNHYPLIIFHYYPFLSSDYYSIGHISLWSIIIQWLLFHRSYSIIIQWLLFHHISIIHDIPVIINHDQWIKNPFIDHSPWLSLITWLHIPFISPIHRPPSPTGHHRCFPPSSRPAVDLRIRQAPAKERHGLQRAATQLRELRLPEQPGGFTTVHQWLITNHIHGG